MAPLLKHQQAAADLRDHCYGLSNQVNDVGARPEEATCIPDSFLCPLTLEIMQDPLMSRYGHNYERRAILEWLNNRGNTVCPLTKQPLTASGLLPNARLRHEIMGWLIQNGVEEDPANNNIGGNVNVKDAAELPFMGIMLVPQELLMSSQSGPNDHNGSLSASSNAINPPQSPSRLPQQRPQKTPKRRLLRLLKHPFRSTRAAGC